jgi:hypothetical protein
VGVCEAARHGGTGCLYLRNSRRRSFRAIHGQCRLFVNGCQRWRQRPRGRCATQVDKIKPSACARDSAELQPSLMPPHHTDTRTAPVAVLGVCTRRSSPEGHGDADGTRAYAMGEARALGVALSQIGCRAGIMAVTQWCACGPPHRWAQRGRWRRHQLDRGDYAQRIGDLACDRRLLSFRRLDHRARRYLGVLAWSG